MNFLQSIAASFLQSRGKSAISWHSGSISREAFSRKVAGVQNYLSRGKDRLIPIITGTEADAYSGLFGIWFSGNGAVPIDYRADDRTAQMRLNAVNPSLILVTDGSESLAKKAVVWYPEARIIHTSDIPDHDPTEPEPMIPGRIAGLYPSNDYGALIPATFGNLTALAQALHPFFNVEAEGTVLQQIHPAYISSLQEFLPPLFAGWTLQLDDHKVPVPELINIGTATTAFFRPSLLHPLIPALKPGSLKTIFCYGEPLPVFTAKAAAEITGAKIINLFGMPETTGPVTAHQFDPESETHQHQYDALPLGKPLTGSRFRIAGESETGPGELLISGNQVFSGYWNNPDKNESIFDISEEGYSTVSYLKTGLMVRKAFDGEYRLCGSSSPKNTYLSDKGSTVESAVRRYSLALHPLVLPEVNELGNPVTVLCCTGDVTEQELRSYLVSNLPGEQVPEIIIVLESYPRTLDGRIDRKVLRATASKYLG